MSDETTTEATTTDETTATETEPLGDAGKSALKAERDARKAAEKTAKETQDRLTAFESAAAKAADEKAKEQGEWKELAEKREADLTDATTSLTTATSELDTLRTYVTADIAAAIKDLPKPLLAFDPGEDAPLAQRLDWLTKAKANAEDMAKDTKKPGNGPNPPAADGKFDLDAAVERARSAGRYRV